MSELISVIVPVYNTEKYLPSCMESVLNQTYKNIEVLLIDDGSKTACAELCESYAKVDPRVKVVHKENGGLHSSRNCGLEHATGEYVIFVDSDDWLSKEMLSTMMEAAVQWDADIVRCNYIREFTDKSLIKENHFLEEKVYKDSECKKLCRMTVGLIHEELSHPEDQNVMAPVWLHVYKRSLIENHRLRFESLAVYGTFEDGLFNIQAYYNAKCVVYVDKAFYHYRKNVNTSITKSHTSTLLEKYKKQYGYIRNILKNAELENKDEAMKSRIGMSILGLSFNAIVNRDGFKARYKELKGILTDEEVNGAISALDKKYMPLKWKLYYGFAKCKMTAFVYFMTYAINKLIERGTK